MPYKHKVGGSNPSSTTIKNQRPYNGAFFMFENIHIDLNPVRAECASGAFWTERAKREVSTDSRSEYVSNPTPDHH